MGGACVCPVSGPALSATCRDILSYDAQVPAQLIASASSVNAPHMSKGKRAESENAHTGAEAAWYPIPYTVRCLDGVWNRYKSDREGFGDGSAPEETVPRIA
jgi:hypothetical protein